MRKIQRLQSGANCIAQIGRKLKTSFNREAIPFSSLPKSVGEEIREIQGGRS